jgi:hypothetical protein
VGYARVGRRANSRRVRHAAHSQTGRHGRSDDHVQAGADVRIDRRDRDPRPTDAREAADAGERGQHRHPPPIQCTASHREDHQRRAPTATASATHPTTPPSCS